jgi:hypothetical protein
MKAIISHVHAEDEQNYDWYVSDIARQKLQRFVPWLCDNILGSHNYIKNRQLGDEFPYLSASKFILGCVH